MGVRERVISILASAARASTTEEIVEASGGELKRQQARRALHALARNGKVHEFILCRQDWPQETTWALSPSHLPVR